MNEKEVVLQLFRVVLPRRAKRKFPSCKEAVYVVSEAHERFFKPPSLLCHPHGRVSNALWRCKMLVTYVLTCSISE